MAVSLEDLLQTPEAQDSRPVDRGGRSISPWARTAAGAAVVLALLAAALWWTTGGRWQTVATPSMGEAAPVGTLVLTRPVTTGEVEVGDIVTFRSPATAGRIYTHRVVEIDAAGGLHTRGDINGAEDPSILHTDDLIGRVVARWWGVGWLLKALPVLVIGGLLLWVLPRRWALPDRRAAIRILGASILVSGCAAILKPFVNFLVMVTVPAQDGTELTLVSTGLLPIRISATGGDHLDLVDGGIGALTASGEPGANGYELTSAVHLTLAWWVALIFIWSVPLLVALVLSRESRRPEAPDDDPPGGPVDSGTTGGPLAVPAHHRRSSSRRSQKLIAVLALSAAFAAAVVPPTQSAFAARVTNPTNSAASNPYFTCLAAATSPQGPSFFAFPLSETLLLGAADVSGNGRNGTYATLGAWSTTTSRPCPRDTSISAVVSGGTASSTNYIASTASLVNPTVFSVEIWFQTGATIGGRLIGFSDANNQLLISSLYDRHIYMSTTGQLYFGVFPNAFKLISSPGSYADGQWHQVVGTLGPTGQRLYVDGALVASDPTTTTAQVFTGAWRVGYDNLATWPNAPAGYNFRGALAWASVYTTQLSATLVQQHYAAGR
ncbi:hypothetical protein GCM10009818_00140 [Nakamurella flavida]